MNNRIDMSLDDIIRTKRGAKTKNFRPRKEPVRNRIMDKRNFGQKKNFVANKRANFDLSQKLKGRNTKNDARFTIFFNQRAKIHDARDKLNQMARKTDARFKIRDKIAKKTQTVTTFDPRTMQQIKQQLLNSNSQRSMMMGSRGLTRTIGNNFRNSRASTSRLSETNKRIIMNQDGILITTRNEGKLRTTRIANSMDFDDNPFQVRSLTQTSTHTFPRSRLSANLQSRLDGNSHEGCKVIVSNLHPSVTQDDIQELFGEIGDLRRASLGKSGTAEILFMRPADAQKACDVYHNRQLDGIPMNLKISCNFGGFRSDSMPSRVAPDAALIRQALFGEPRVSAMASNPRFNVRMNRN
uniref:RRM domain-containing protein n=1 Tax=Strigamia maritima TaxID=126957 RepID=T1IH32_STRMM